MKPSFFGRIARNSATLPVVCVTATLLWWLPQGGYSATYLSGWLFAALTTYVVLETAAVVPLLRLRSRMVSSLFLLWLTVCGFLHTLQPSLFCLLAMAVVLWLLLPETVEKSWTSKTFQAYLSLSLGSLFWTPLLCLAPMVLIWQGLILRRLGLRALGAAVMGLLLPYIYWAAATATIVHMTPLLPQLNVFSSYIPPLNSDLSLFTPHLFEDALDGRPFLAETYLYLLHYVHPTYAPHGIAASLQSTTDAIHSIHTISFDNFRDTLIQWAQPRQARLAALGSAILMGLTGFIHYWCHRLDDATRVRQAHLFLLHLQTLLLVWLLLQPHHFIFLFPLYLLAIAPAAAHYILFAGARSSVFWIFLLAAAMTFTAFLTLNP